MAHPGRQPDCESIDGTALHEGRLGPAVSVTLVPHKAKGKVTIWCRPWADLDWEPMLVDAKGRPVQVPLDAQRTFRFDGYFAAVRAEMTRPNGDRFCMRVAG